MMVYMVKMCKDMVFKIDIEKSVDRKDICDSAIMDDGKACKKLCSDFGIVLGGSGSGKSKEQKGGILY